MDTHRQPGRVVSTLVGSTVGYVDGGPSEAKFKYPCHVTFNPIEKCIYVCEPNQYVIRKITLDGTTSTFAGIGGQGGYENGITTKSLFNLPASSAFYVKEKALFVSDYGNNVIRQISSTGMVTLFAGSGDYDSKDGVATQASFHRPDGICVDQRNGDVYVAEFHGHRIRKISHHGWTGSEFISKEAANLRQKVIHELGSLPLFIWAEIISFCENPSLGSLAQVCCGCYYFAKQHMIGRVVTLAGSDRGFADGVGGEVKLYYPTSLCLSEREECLYISDYFNHLIRKLDLKTGRVSSIAGTPEQSGLLDGEGSVAKFDTPWDVRLLPGNDRSLLVADMNNHRIRLVKLPEQDGDPVFVETFAGCEMGDQDGDALECRFNVPQSICIDPENNVCYIADTTNYKIRKMTLM